MMKRFFLLFVIAEMTQAVAAQPADKYDNAVAATRELRTVMQSDPHRPVYHFVAPEGIAVPFDPNGAIYWNGKYHLGYIYVQYLKEGKKFAWGHAVSTDLFHWTQYPDMIVPKAGDLERGIFSGGAFLSKEGVPYIIYHGEGSATNLIVHSDDKDLREWVDKTPVLTTPQEGDPMFGKYKAWDPEGWYDPQADCYYQISGGNPAGFFKSKDMKDWQYLGDFIAPEQRQNNAFEDISCPDFFSIGNKKILLFLGHYLGTQYYIGTFSNDKFTVENYGRMNWPGGTFFAPEQLVDNRGRNIILGWVLERKPSHLQDFGWSGIMSLPRVLTLSKKNQLLINPPDEVKNIRINELKEKNITLSSNSEKRLKATGTAMEIQLELRGGAHSPYGLKVFCSPDNREETIIQYNPATEELVVDFSRSSIHAPVEYPKYCMTYYPPETGVEEEVISQQRAPLKLNKSEMLKLDVFIDRSVIEIFANGRQCLTQVVYPELPESTGIAVFSGKEPLEVKNITSWEMPATNPY
jgi:sucrose-6-phosphate hydrolase SacC (GH32 family)